MKHNCAKKIAGGCFALAMTFALAQPMLADDLNTEMASAGAAVDIENYISSTGSEDGLSSYLPAPEKTENKTTKPPIIKIVFIELLILFPIISPKLDNFIVLFLIFDELLIKFLESFFFQKRNKKPTEIDASK